jgi:hypothetical protein
MLDPRYATDGLGVFVWFGGVALAAFIASWVLTDLLEVRRTLYVGLLALITAGLTAGYVAWSGQGSAFWNDNWPLGVLGAVVTGGFLAVSVRRLPVPSAGHHMDAEEGLWEGLVYGAAEGLLLSVLPVVIVWQGLAAHGWTEGWLTIPAGLAALAGSAFVIVVHHLGYREFRNRKIIQALFGCGVLSLGSLLTASPIAAIGGHVVLHLAMLRRGMELPPHVYGRAGVTESSEARLAA